MKPFWIVLLAVLCVGGLAAGTMRLQTESALATSLEAEVAALKAENAKLNAQVASANEKVTALESESAQLRAARAMASTRLAPEASPTPEAAEENPKEARGGFFAKMMKDPAMRKMIAAQQATALRGFYSEFVKEANLTPDEAQQFYKLLEDRQAALLDSSASMMSGGKMDVNAATAATSTAESALKDLLGPNRFAMYQGFEKTLGNRVQVQQFNQQLSSDGMPLQDYQNKALVQIMSEESANANLPNFRSPNGSAIQQLGNMSQADIDQYSQQVAAMNQRVYTRATSVLNSQQLSAFATFQQNMANAQMLGLKMTQQMFKGGE